MKPVREGMPSAPLELALPAVPEVETAALGDLIESLCVGDRDVPILDWTTHGVAQHISGWTLFRPVEPDARVLPYLDHTIEVVLVDETERMDEAVRVAAGTAVLVTTDDSGGARVAETRRMRSEPVRVPAPVLILVATQPDDEWLGSFTEAVAGRPGVEVEAAIEPLVAIAETDAPTIVLAERGVLPLPRCIDAAEGLLAAEPRVGGVAVKLVDLDGTLEAAGAAVFADGSVAGIARGAPPAAPWHEYVRPVAAAVGLVVLRSAAARQCVGAEDTETLDLAVLSARLWSSGWELRYQPDAAAVRVHAPAAAAPGVWVHAPDGLPERPATLDDRAWRRLLARHEVEVFR